MKMLISGSSEYEIDTELLTCTCRDFVYRRSRFNLTDPERLCKHLLSVKEELTPSIDDIKRVSREVANRYISEILPVILTMGSIERFEIVGSHRRLKEFVKDLDFLLVTKDNLEPSEFYTNLIDNHGYIKLRQGAKFASFEKNGFQVDFKVIPEETYPFSLMHFTGSREENIRLRRIATSKGYSLSEYGLNGESKNLKTEKDIYEFLGEVYKEPWNR